MKKLFFTGTLLFILFKVQAQSEMLTEINQERLNVNRVGMLTLGSWALGNIAINGLLSRNASGSTRHFYLGNVYWNLVNLGLAGAGYWSAVGADPGAFTLQETLREYFGIQKILLFNAGLDVAYITAGFFLKERSKNLQKQADRFKGYGNALILQGGFLLAFDLALFMFHQSNIEFLQQLSLSPDGFSMVIRF